MDTRTRPSENHRHMTQYGDRPPRLLLTVEEAADRIGICRSSMFKLIREGDIISVKVGRLRRVTPAALEDFVARLSGGEPA
jgi:excisionase family DNA binding protein